MHRHRWDEISVVHARTARRLVSVSTIELDLGETLVVVPAYRLGAEAGEVAAALEELRTSE
ncbi:MAG: PH domain-containing protein [Actinomycetes bacterium]